MRTDVSDIENKLWAAADQSHPDSRLTASEYSIPVLALLFLRRTDQRFADAETRLSGESLGRRKIGKDDARNLFGDSTAVCLEGEVVGSDVSTISDLTQPAGWILRQGPVTP